MSSSVPPPDARTAAIDDFIRLVRSPLALMSTGMRALVAEQLKKHDITAFDILNRAYERARNT